MPKQSSMKIRKVTKRKQSSDDCDTEEEDKKEIKKENKKVCNDEEEENKEEENKDFTPRAPRGQVGAIKFDCMDVLPLNSKIYESKDPTENVIFSHPFFSIFLGPSRSGKTTTWINMLKNPDMLFNRFQEIYYFITTWDDDDIYQDNLITDERFVVKDFDPQFFEHIIEEKERIVQIAIEKAEDGKDINPYDVLPKSLFIVDDNIGNRNLSGRLWSMMDVLATRGRKFNISTILTLQYLRGHASTVVRGNTSDLVCFFLPNKKEQKRVLEEFCGSVKMSDMLAMYNYCFQYSHDKYNFFHIQTFNTNNFTKYRKNFNTILIPPSLKKQFLLTNKLWGAEGVQQRLEWAERPVLGQSTDQANKEEESKPCKPLKGMCQPTPKTHQ